MAEQLFLEWSFNQHLHQRVVASGVWEYLVDLATMTQKNVTHPNATVRHIRRWTAALGDDQTPPGDLAGASSPHPALAHCAGATRVRPR